VHRTVKCLRLRRFKSDQDEIWQVCSSKCRHRLTKPNFRFDVDRTFKIAAMTSFYVTKCCHLVSENESSAGAYAAACVNYWSIAPSTSVHVGPINNWYDYYDVSVGELLCFVDEMLQQTADTLTNFMTWRAICRAHNLTHTAGIEPIIRLTFWPTLYIHRVREKREATVFWA